MKFILFFGLLTGYILYSMNGLEHWSIYLYATVFLVWFLPFGSKSIWIKLLLLTTSVLLERSTSVLRNQYRSFLSTLDPDLSKWLNTETYFGSLTWQELPALIFRYSGLEFIWYFNFNHFIAGYTLPESILLILCIFGWLGLFVALLNTSHLNDRVHNLLDWSNLRRNDLPFLYIPKYFPAWISEKISHAGWSAGVLVFIFPLMVFVMLLVLYFYLIYYLFIYFPFKGIIYLFGIGENHVPDY